jgi:hypothetical protein
MLIKDYLAPIRLDGYCIPNGKKWKMTFFCYRCEGWTDTKIDSIKESRIQFEPFCCEKCGQIVSVCGIRCKTNYIEIRPGNGYYCESIPISRSVEVELKYHGVKEC